MQQQWDGEAYPVAKYWPRGMGVHIVRHPSDGIVVATAAWRLRRRRWWCTPPFLPVPDERYWAFRLATATGSPEGEVSVDEAIAAARWSRAQSRGN